MNFKFRTFLFPTFKTEILENTVFLLTWFDKAVIDGQTDIRAPVIELLGCYNEEKKLTFTYSSGPTLCVSHAPIYRK